MVSPEDAFVVLAELSLTLVGFSAVVAAFGGRERDFSQAEQLRLEMIFWSSGGALAGCLLLFVVSGAGLAATTGYTVVGVSMFAIRTLEIFRIVPKARQNLRDEETTVSRTSFVLSALWNITVHGLYLAAAFLGGESWPLLAGFSLQLLFGIAVFSRLLTTRI